MKLSARLVLPLLLLLSVSLTARDSIEKIKTPGGGLNPQVAVDGSGTAHMIYFKGEAKAGNIYYVKRTSASTNFSDPVRVNSQKNAAIVAGTVRAPHLAVGANGRVHVAWMGSGKAEPAPPEGSRPLLYARSKPNGEWFTKQKNVLRFAKGLNGGATVAASGQRVYVVWHGNPEGTGEENRQVFVAKSTNGGETFQPETPLTKKSLGVCGCCGINARVDEKERLNVLFRSATGGTQRDAYFLKTGVGGSSPTLNRLQSWKKKACPMSTFSIGPCSGGRLLAWEREGQVYFTVSRFGGKRMPEPVSPPGAQSNRKHPAITGNGDGRILMAWTEGTGWEKGGKLAWHVFDGNGNPTDRGGRTGGIAPWDRPAVYARPDGGFTIIY